MDGGGWRISELGRLHCRTQSEHFLSSESEDTYLIDTLYGESPYKHIVGLVLVVLMIVVVNDGLQR